MRGLTTALGTATWLLVVLMAVTDVVTAQVGQSALQECEGLAMSTEIPFVTQGPEPPDGNPIISGGDLLGIVDGESGSTCVVCARNSDLLEFFDVSVDVGLDAADVIDVGSYIVAFSTELDSPNAGQFTSGDLLVTTGAIIPNLALTYMFDVGHDVGLDAVHFVGEIPDIVAFLVYASQIPPAGWLDPATRLSTELSQFEIDIWFSTEEASAPTGTPAFLDGDLLSARTGLIVAENEDLFPLAVPAGIPVRGVDFGLDAVCGSQVGVTLPIMFSPEILYPGTPRFGDGDALVTGDFDVFADNARLFSCFEPLSEKLGLDALSGGRIPAMFTDGFESQDTGAWSRTGAGGMAVNNTSAYSGDYGLEVSVWPFCVSPDNVSLGSQTVTTLLLVERCHSISAGDGFIVGDGGHARFIAGQHIALRNGFSVEMGGLFVAVIDASMPPFAFVQDDSPSAESAYSAGFYVNLDNLVVGPGNEVEHLVGYDGLGEPQFKVLIRSGPVMVLEIRDDLGVFHSSPAAPVSSGWNRVAMNWQASAMADAALALNFGPPEVLAGLDTSDRRIEFVRWGAVRGVVDDSSGTIKLDNFVSWH